LAELAEVGRTLKIDRLVSVREWFAGGRILEVSTSEDAEEYYS
jgi:hypothetical protein